MIKNVLTILTLLLLAPFVCAGQDNDEFNVNHGPYLQNTGKNGVTIMWTTNKAAVPGVTIISPDGRKRFVRNSEDGIINGGSTVHKVRIEGLLPSTTYRYRLHSVQILKYQPYKIFYGDTISGKEISFATYPESSKKVAFTVINDVHELSGKMASYLRNNNIVKQNFYFFNGDMIGHFQETEQLWPGFIDTASYYFASARPFYYVRGNHETRGTLARDLKKYFDYENDRYYYSFTYGPVHFIILDCGEDKPDDNRYYYGLADYDAYRLEELEWLKDEVKSEEFRNAKKRIVICHFPVLKEEKQGHGMKFMADNFGPVLKSAGIDIMFSGHLHMNAFHEAGKSGFNYPVLVNSHNTFVEVEADEKEINILVKDEKGNLINSYNFD